MTYDMREAISKIDSIPLVKESIPELTKLANGFDPSIPGYLALGRLHQITSLAESAQTAKPPQGTIKDKTTQAAGLMALMGGRGQMAAQNSAAQTMNQAGPVPQNTPEPEMQTEAAPEEMMGMAEGGITSMDIDPRMFNFDGGGIVTFANPEKEKKQLVKDEERKSSFDSLIESLISPFKGAYEAGQEAGEYVRQSPGYFERLTPTERAAKEAKAAPFALNAPSREEREAAKQAALEAQQSAYRAEQNRLRAGHKAAMLSGNSSDSPSLQAAPPAPPMGGINDGSTRVPGANIGPITVGPTQAMPENKFLTATEKFVNQQPEAFNEAAEAAKIAARNKAAGIGTYADVMRQQQADLAKQFEASRPTMNEDIVGMLRRYARPGAMAGDVGDEVNTQMRTEREARMQFKQDQFKITEAVERLEEARRTNDVAAIAKAEADLKKANADLRNHQMTAAASAASTVSADQRSAADRAQQLAIENSKLSMEKAKLAQLSRDPEAIRILKQVEALEAQGKTTEALALIEKVGRIHAAITGARYTGAPEKNKDWEHEKLVQQTIKDRAGLLLTRLQSGNLKPEEEAKLNAKLKKITDQVRAEYPTPGAKAGAGGAKPTLEQFLGAARAKNPGVSDADLKAYYNENYGE